MAKYPVEKYALRIYSTMPTPENQMVAIIYCYEETTSGLKSRGNIKFYPDDTPLHPATHDATNGLIYLHFHQCQFDATTEILRTEKPLYLVYKANKNAYLGSGVEPTGEEETP